MRGRGMGVAHRSLGMEKSSESRAASGAVVGLFLVLLVGIILGLGSSGALAAPSDGAGLNIGIAR